MIRYSYLAITTLVVVSLSGCGGVTATDVATALKDDPNSACVHVENSYPPFQNKFTVVRTGKDGVAVLVNSDCSISPASPTTTPTK